jgi:UDP-N-acetylmuramate-alanine ligase
MGAFASRLPEALSVADVVVMYRDARWSWGIDMDALSMVSCYVESSYDAVVDRVVAASEVGDVIVCMSNGGFDAVPEKICRLLMR